MRWFIFYLLLLTGPTRLCAQNEASKWYFGVNAGLDFMTSPPSILTNGQMIAGEGSTGISDAAGNLLFYSDGSTIWNSAHVPMANGTGLAGSSAATQCGIVIKQPGNSNIYYIFTLMYNLIGGLTYSTIDMNLAAGMGSVTVKNAVAYSGTCVEKLAATKHCNGQDIWVLSHDYNNNNYRAFLVTSAGVNTVAIVSAVGVTHSTYHGQMKISPNGKKIGVALGYTSSCFEVLDFDNATGVISNPTTLFSPVPPNYYTYNYGCEFSADGTMFYGSTIAFGIFQWNLCAGSASAVAQSRYSVTTGDAFSLQLAPNGKIYAARPDSTQGVINNPEIIGSGCNFVYSGQSVVPNIGNWGLPNFMSSYLKKVKPFDFFVDSADCQTIHFSQPCTPAPGPNFIAWNFGDPASGLNQSATANPTHQFSGAGTYSVQLILYYNCSTDTVIKQIVIPGVPTISITGNQSICAGQTATLVASGAVSYSWNTSAIGPMANVSPSSTTVYTVTGSTSIDNCRSNATFTISVKPIPTVGITGNQTVCESDTLIFQSTGANTYTWNSGITGSVQMIASPVTGSVISVTGSDQNGCQSAASVTLSTFPSPTIIINGNNEICAGESSTLNASGGNSYLWQLYGSTPTIVVSPLSTTVYTVTATSTLGNCNSTELYMVNVSLCTDIKNQLITGEKILSIYPNPAINRININTVSKTDIKIYDSFGRLVYVAFIDSGDNLIDISKLNSGIYYVSSPKLGAEIKFLKIVE